MSSGPNRGKTTKTKKATTIRQIAKMATDLVLRYFNRKSIAQNPAMAEIIIPSNNTPGDAPAPLSTPFFTTSFISNTVAPNVIGSDIKKENRAASSRFNPRKCFSYLHLPSPKKLSDKFRRTICFSCPVQNRLRDALTGFSVSIRIGGVTHSVVGILIA